MQGSDLRQEFEDPSEIPPLVSGCLSPQNALEQSEILEPLLFEYYLNRNALNSTGFGSSENDETSRMEGINVKLSSPMAVILKQQNRSRFFADHQLQQHIQL